MFTVLSQVLLCLCQWPPKGLNNPYDPLNFDPDVHHEYGGYVEEGGRYGGGRYGDR